MPVGSHHHPAQSMILSLSSSSFFPPPRQPSPFKCVHAARSGGGVGVCVCVWDERFGTRKKTGNPYGLHACVLDVRALRPLEHQEKKRGGALPPRKKKDLNNTENAENHMCFFFFSCCRSGESNLGEIRVLFYGGWGGGGLINVTHSLRGGVFFYRRGVIIPGPATHR